MNTHTDEETMILQTFSDRLEADLAKEKLDAQGISAFLVDENVVGLNPLGGIELKIFSKDFEQAKQILDEKPGE